MNPRNLFADPSPLSGLRSIVAMLAAWSVLLSGCVSTRYKMAPEKTPPPMPLNLAATQPPLEVMLNMVILYKGPGSWKRAAFWDEYVVTLRNQGNQPLTIASAALADFAGVRRAPDDNPWALEKESKTLERKYRDAGIAFVRYTAPGGILAVAGVSFAEASLMSAGAAGAATVCFVALPVYYTGVIMINHHNKVAVEKEFHRRRLGLPLTLAPGETRIGSFFFPMVPNPRSLSLRWASGAAGDEILIPLESLHGLHIKASVQASVHN